MRERDMRQRVERFLQARLRTMLLPATLGLGLAVGACNSDGLSADDGGDSTATKDSGSVATKYMAQLPDASIKLDSGMVARYMGPMPVDASRVVAVYSAPVPVTRS
jgi:hypothetical protein